MNFNIVVHIRNVVLLSPGMQGLRNCEVGRRDKP